MTDGVIIYHNPRCSKSRETLKLLEDKEITPSVVKYLDTPPNPDTLSDILQMLKIEDPRQLMRTHEQEYKDNNLADLSLSRDDLINAMVKFPRIIERPIVISNGKAAIGRPPVSILDIL
ncbi:MAG: Arsenate reductase (EC [uncultured Thiotrichaceae bacterium]|uniref:Arsenate reductase n=1 Tax=uncultured Thiotrichaceae bacterium TaxID=298394 RepID=A0A6S6TY44_9GAMM|nr:MAG: Arsenate reductase (EC [uncultured Thiotrichaceae bacterium]